MGIIGLEGKIEAGVQDEESASLVVVEIMIGGVSVHRR
jgi:hypothetical protein